MGWVDFIPNIRSWVEFQAKIAGGVRRVGLVRSLRRCRCWNNTGFVEGNEICVPKRCGNTNAEWFFCSKKKRTVTVGEWNWTWEMWWLTNKNLSERLLTFPPIIMEVEDALIWKVSTNGRNSFFHFHDFLEETVKQPIFFAMTGPSVLAVRACQNASEKSANCTWRIYHDGLRCLASEV